MPVQRRVVTVGNTQTLTSRVGIVRILAVICACVTFSLVVQAGTVKDSVWDLCMFSWCFCFAVSLIILIVEFAGIQNRMPVSWRNFPITFAMYAVLMCLSASVLYPVYFLSDRQYHSKTRNYQIVATVFSCLTTVAYMLEVSFTRAKPGEVTGYMATTPGLLKVLETYIACIIFVFISDQNEYQSYDALKWCLAVYCICFIIAVGIIILCVGECTGWMPCAFNKFLSAYALFAVLAYITAMIIWPLYKFDREHGGNPRRPSYCTSVQLCQWDKQLAVAILTGINLLIYIADLVHSTRLIFISV
ncbi:myeloid-associated differentiation marker [Discoglossus pictus]